MLRNNNLNRGFKALLILNLFIFVCSCKKNLEEDHIKNEINEVKKEVYQFHFDLPDTMVVNEMYNGKIDYKGKLDNITTSLDDEKKYRSIHYYFLKTQSIQYDLNELKKKLTDTLITDTHENIPLFDISFDKLGVNYLDGIVFDKVMIDTMQVMNGKLQPTVRVITNEFRATHKVVVIEKKK